MTKQISDVFDQSRSEANIAATLTAFSKLEIDPVWSSRVVDLVRTVADIRAILRYLARETWPAAYLEVGVRRGFSMAMVASVAPGCDLYGFDAWVPDYAGVDNPGPKFVASEIAKFGHCGKLEFFNGRSVDTLPKFFGTTHVRPNLILVDGDHSPEGAQADLELCLPQLAEKGYLVFDDLFGPLGAVWEETKKRHAESFRFGERDSVGIASKRRARVL